MSITGSSAVAAVVGAPVAHSLSPILHNAWLAAADIDGVYVALAPGEGGFARLIDGLRGGSMRGVNVTLPFKTDALAVADQASERARRAGAANLLVFEADGSISADNSDGEGLLAAFAEQAPEVRLTHGPVVILGAGGAARGAAAALAEAGVPEVRIVNRTHAKASALADLLGGVVRAVEGPAAFADAAAIVNATSAGLSSGGEALSAHLVDAPMSAVVMDMVYKPLETPLLAAARARGHATVDGLAMLIGQARPAFAALFGAQAPDIDVRGAALAVLEGQA